MSILGWATDSNDRAVANARDAAVECSRRRLERAEVAQSVAELTAAYAGRRPQQGAAVAGHDVRTSAHAR